jgi:hypothetical protein
LKWKSQPAELGLADLKEANNSENIRKKTSCYATLCRMKKLPHNPIFNLVLPLWLILVLACSTQRSTTPAPDSSSGPPVSVSSATLINEYEDNEVSADDRYKGKTLRVSGTVDNIAKDIMDSMYVTLKGDKEYGITSVQCYFADDQKSALSRLKKGQQVTIVGRCDGKFGNVLLKDSRLD